MHKSHFLNKSSIYNNIYKIIEQNEDNGHLWLEGLGVISNIPRAFAFDGFNLKSYFKIIL